MRVKKGPPRPDWMIRAPCERSPGSGVAEMGLRSGVSEDSARPRHG